jgi:tetraacyldisaccharide 4'-kinase
LPISLIYFIAITVRNFLYDKGLIKRIKFDVPIISVGNITTGGSGKTPFVIYLAEYFLGKDKRVAIISRGYKRVSKGFITVLDADSVCTDISKSGDELYMIANSLKKISRNNLYIAADKNRIRAIYKIQNCFNPDIIILDDAFQRRNIYKNLEIVLEDENDFKKNALFINRTLLPAGNLREPGKSLKRADILILNNKFDNDAISIKTNFKSNTLPIIKYKINELLDINGNKYSYKNEKVTAFCGIAKPESFFNALEILKFNIIRKYIYKDHYKYKKNDLEKMKKDYQQNMIFVTTEKDFNKISVFDDFVRNFPVLFLKIGIEFSEKKEYLEEKLNNLFIR